MIRDITLGQYYQTDSIIHRLDPRVKLLGTVLFFVSLFLFNNPIGYLIALVFMIIVIKLSKVPFSFMVKGMKSIVIIMMITVIMNLFMTPGEVIVSWGKINITIEGIVTAAQIALRLSMFVIGSSIMTLTTTPTRLTDGLEKGLGFLKIFRVPVHSIAMMMSIALRFIPILLEETDKIMKAQLARGADLESGNIFKRARAYVPILVPLFVSAFRRANDLAMAMEARCYGGNVKRTKMKPLKYHRRDAIAYIILIIYMVGGIWLGRMKMFSVYSLIEFYSELAG